MEFQSRFNSFLLGTGITVFFDTFNYAREDVDEYRNRCYHTL